RSAPQGVTLAPRGVARHLLVSEVAGNPGVTAAYIIKAPSLVLAERSPLETEGDGWWRERSTPLFESLWPLVSKTLIGCCSSYELFGPSVRAAAAGSLGIILR